MPFGTGGCSYQSSAENGDCSVPEEYVMSDIEPVALRGASYGDLLAAEDDVRLSSLRAIFSSPSPLRSWSSMSVEWSLEASAFNILLLCC
jgi:hypothetical protein